MYWFNLICLITTVLGHSKQCQKSDFFASPKSCINVVALAGGVLPASQGLGVGISAVGGAHIEGCGALGLDGHVDGAGCGRAVDGVGVSAVADGQALDAAGDVAAGGVAA